MSLGPPLWMRLTSVPRWGVQGVRKMQQVQRLCELGEFLDGEMETQRRGETSQGRPARAGAGDAGLNARRSGRTAVCPSQPPPPVNASWKSSTLLTS